jgi:hypothetical protein
VNVKKIIMEYLDTVHTEEEHMNQKKEIDTKESFQEVRPPKFL